MPQLNDAVVCSQFLQYLLRVGRSGLHDPMLPGYTIPQRIEALERWEATWRNLEAQSSFQVKRIVPCDLAGEICSTYIIRDDFLIATHGFHMDPGYGYVDLRVFQPGGETGPWTTIVMDNWSRKRSRFQFFPEQDLVVAIFWSREIDDRLTSFLRSLDLLTFPESISGDNSLIEIHGFSFSRGTPHPRFVSATITTIKYLTSVNVTIVGNHTILDVSLRDSQRLFSTRGKTDLRDAPIRTQSECCAVLSHDTIALIEDDTATLEIPVYSDKHSLVVGGPGRPPRRHPFHTSPEERIVVIAFRIGHDDHLAIVTHVRTLMAHAETTLPEVNFISWKDWGPSGTACFKRYINILDDACVGERLATISDGSLSLFDFNSARVQNAIREAGRPSQNAAHSVVKDKVVIPRGQSFEMDVVSELPYISVVIPTPRNWKGLRNYEEGLAGFSKDIRGRNDLHRAPPWLRLARDSVALLGFSCCHRISGHQMISFILHSESITLRSMARWTLEVALCWHLADRGALQNDDFDYH
ncbi:hypothetical protein BC826DRAFT_1122693 [Russula brevipes]|nr:hypothetical protein BC826DRAFT_1122693 [Russula brevipes]